MTEAYTGEPAAEDVVDEPLDAASTRRSREADAFLERAQEPAPVHRAMREDARAVRDWGQSRALQMREAVEAEPLRASLYALGIGVLIGMLLRR